jgi:hypothetical protein
MPDLSDATIDIKVEVIGEAADHQVGFRKSFTMTYKLLATPDPGTTAGDSLTADYILNDDSVRGLMQLDLTSGEDGPSGTAYCIRRELRKQAKVWSPDDGSGDGSGSDNPFGSVWILTCDYEAIPDDPGGAYDDLWYGVINVWGNVVPRERFDVIDTAGTHYLNTVGDRLFPIPSHWDANQLFYIQYRSATAEDEAGDDLQRQDITNSVNSADVWGFPEYYLKFNGCVAFRRHCRLSVTPPAWIGDAQNLWYWEFTYCFEYCKKTDPEDDIDTIGWCPTKILNAGRRCTQGSGSSAVTTWIVDDKGQRVTEPQPLNEDGTQADPMDPDFTPYYQTFWDFDLEDFASAFPFIAEQHFTGVYSSLTLPTEP